MAVLTLRYARAFEQVVHSMQLDPAAALQQLKDFAGTFAGSSQLREILMDPSIPNVQKLKVIDAIAEKIGMAKQVRNFIAVITDHQRLHELPEIVTEYASVADDRASVTDAEITSARPLNDEDRQQFVEKLSVMTSGRVRVTYHEDGTLLGGAIVKIGSTIYDGSVRGQLQQMKQKLINA